MTLKTLDNSLELLKYFNHETPAWGVRELAKEMDMSHSIVYRILATFENHGFLRQNPESKKYGLGTKFWEYGLLVQENRSTSEIVFPVMKRLAEETGEFISLNWLDGQEGICVAIVESPQSVKFTLSVGTRTSLYPGARSKMILAYLPEEQQKDVLKKELPAMGHDCSDDLNPYLEELRQIRRTGWCYSVGERTEAVFGLSVPLFNHRQQIIASLTFAGPQYRMPEGKIPETLRILKEGQTEIQQQFDKMDLPFIEKETKRFKK